jgi:hypothetical protein
VESLAELRRRNFLTTQELINELSKMPPDHEISIVLDLNDYTGEADPNSEPDFLDVLPAGMPFIVFPDEGRKSVDIIIMPFPQMERLRNLARNDD